MKPKYSIWLIPQDEVFSQHIIQLAKKYHCSPFTPHVTLLKNIKLSREDATARLEKLASVLQPFPIKLDVVNYADDHHQAVFIHVKKTQDLDSAHKKAEEIFNLDDTPYQPHLSLVYGDLPVVLKQRIMKSIDKSFNDTFIVQVLDLYDTSPKDERFWKSIQKISL